LLTLQSSRFIDNSSNALVPTVTGTPSVQAFGPFAPALQWTPDVVGGSGYFDGTGDYLILPSSSAFAMGTGQFCLEAWHYPTQNSAGGIVLSTRTGPVNQASSFTLMQYTGTTYSMYANGNHILTSMTPFQWNHVVITRDASNTLRLILNGVLGNYEASYVENITETILSIGAVNNGAETLFGYTTGHRIVKGSIPTTYQTASTTIGATIYTPPTQPVTLTSQGATSGDVSFLCNYTNAGIYDGTMGNDLQTVGTAQVSTSILKYGSGSMQFNGSGNYLVTPYTPNLVFRTGDFTFETWLFWTGGNSENNVIMNNASGGFNLKLQGTTAANWALENSYIGQLADFGTAPTKNVWHHIAVTRASGTLRAFIDGVQVYVGANSTDFVNTGAWYIAGNGNSLSLYMTGFLDDLRITKGIARYQGNFTPPQQALPRQ
jgi:hypothetical protein